MNHFASEPLPCFYVISGNEFVLTDIEKIANHLHFDVECFDCTDTFMQSGQTTNSSIVFLDPETMEDTAISSLCRIRTCGSPENIKIIMLLSAMDRNLTEAFFNNGGNDICSLPIIPAECESKVAALVNQLQLGEDNRKFPCGYEDYKLLFDSTYDWEYLIDKNGQIIYCSPSSKKITGYAQEQFLADQNLIYEIADAGYRLDLKENLLKKNPDIKDIPFSMEYPITTKDGKCKWISLRCVPIFTATKQFRGKRIINRDITEQIEIQQLLIESEKKYYSIFHNAPLGLFRSTPKGKFIEVNPALAKLLGYSSPNEVIKSIKNIAEDVYVKPANRETIVNEVWNDKKINHYVNVYKRKDGSQFTANLYLTTINDSEGNPLYLEGIVEDITEQKLAEIELQNSEQKFRLLFEMIPVATIITEIATGIIIDVNPSFEAETGKSKSEVLGKKTIDLTEMDYLKRQKLMDMYKKYGKVQNFEITSETKAEKRYYHISSVPVTYDNKECFLSAVTNITDLKKAELEHQKVETTLKELNESKDKFFSIIAHDLKNPFQALIGLTDALYTMYDKVPDADKKKYLLNIKKASENAYQLVENLLQWSRSQRGTLHVEIESLFLKTIIDQITEQLIPAAQNKNISILNTIAQMYYVEADSNLLKTVIRNILSNAIKFTYPGGIITISAEPLDNQIYVHFEDNGVGIPEEDQENIFSIGKTDSKKGTNNEAGTGLGLPICKEFMEKMHGTITLESTPGKGSTFTIVLNASEKQ